ncbi:MAG TPA: lipocalin family protein [Aequorivita sp.]|nr:lipocalin family protein [Aequorivita sp.]
MKTIQSQINRLIPIFLLSLALISCSTDDGVPANQAPKGFDLIEVADGATGVSLKPTLTWSAAADPDGDAVVYDLYVGTSNPPTSSIASNLTQTTFTLNTNLEINTAYYWRVVAKDGNGGETASSVYSFKTMTGSNRELLIGKWFIESVGGEVPADECEATSHYEFLDTGRVALRMYTKNTDGDCVIFFNEGGGTWELITDTTVRVMDDIDGSYSYYEILFISETHLTFDNADPGEDPFIIKLIK